MKRLTLLAGCLIFLCAPFVHTLAQQQRTPTKAAGNNYFITEPIKITAFALKTTNSRSARSAAGNGSWVSQPVLQVENTSGKAIKYLVVEVNVPGTKSTSEKSPLMLAFGQAPGQTPLTKLAVLQPGAKVNLTVSRNACDVVSSRLLASGATPPNGSRVKTRINGVIFMDGTAWFDGLPHVADRDDPLRWNVVEESTTQAYLNYAPLFKIGNVSYSTSPVEASSPDQCWKRMGTQWVECCGLMQASAILMQMWGGIYEPFPMSNECEDGSYCEWIKQVFCSSDPRG